MHKDQSPYKLLFGTIEMTNTNPFDQSELIRLALAGLDTQIAELQAKRAQLAAMTNPQPTGTASTVKAATPPSKGGKMSEEAKAKISAAAKARWDKVKKEQAKAAKSAPAAKKTETKNGSAKKAKSKPTAST